ncbi:MAG: aspartyl/asparaginyl beta-hydroxylase domain-containing protein [Pseudomonadota bacterium]
MSLARARLMHVKKPKSVRKLAPVDPAPILERLNMLGERAWDAEDARKENTFECFHNTRHIIHRFTRGNHDVRDHYETPAWLIWRDLLLPVMAAASAPYGFAEPRYPKAMFARLQAGHVIDRHVDGAGSNLQGHKIHIPLVTNPKATFSVADESFHMPVGHAYEVNNISPHGAENHGETDRVHFIFEVYDAAQRPVDAF